MKRPKEVLFMKEKRFCKRKGSVFLLLTIFLLFGSSKAAYAASYSSDYRNWSQGSSDYVGMREVGCLITAQAKMLYEANVNRNAGFNPDSWYNWLLSTGGIASSTNLNMRNHAAPANYAKSIGKNLSYLGYWKADDAQLWFNINAGYYTILYVGNHYVLIDNTTSKATGKLYIYDSFAGSASKNYFTTYNCSPRLLSGAYSARYGGHVYQGSNPSHVHSYSSSVTKAASCTSEGIRTYKCACGASYQEKIPAVGHNYWSKVVAPTTTEKGYTLFTCRNCAYSYKTNYVDSPRKDADGWYYCDQLPSNISSDSYTIEYNNSYEKTGSSSPGSNWKKTEVVRDEWQNSGSSYTSCTDLATSDARVLLSSCYYHYCSASTGDWVNYAQNSKYVHWDSIDAGRVSAVYMGTDEGHPYYRVYLKGSSSPLYCHSGVTCSGYGSHGNRARVWYKMNTYQNRVHVVVNKYTKSSGWIKTKDSSANSVKIRYKAKAASVSKTGSLKMSQSDVKLTIGSTTQLKVTGASSGVSWRSSNYAVAAVFNGKVRGSGIGTARITATCRGKSVTCKVTVYPKKQKIIYQTSRKSGEITVKWSKDLRASGYQICYSTDASFKKGVKTTAVKGRNTVQNTLKKLQRRKTYYIRVRTYTTVGGQNYYGSYSPVVKVKSR